MSRYTDVDAVNGVCPCGYCEGYDSCLKKIQALPSIEIIRCSECKFSELIQNDSRGVTARYCRAFTIPMMKLDDDFCSYGESEQICGARMENRND